MIKRYIVCFVSLLLFITACTTSTSEESMQEEPKETSLQTPVPTIEFVVTFDGNGCVAEGPSEVLPGKYGFKFIDKSDVKGELWLLYVDSEKSFQDLLDEQSEPGEWYAKPSWCHYGSKISGESEETDGGKVEIAVWDLRWVKEYAIMCYVDSPRNLWFVAPINVVETLSN